MVGSITDNTNCFSALLRSCIAHHLSQGPLKLLENHLGDLRGHSLAACFVVMHIVFGNLKLFRNQQHEGMKVVNCDLWHSSSLPGQRRLITWTSRVI